MPFSTIVGHGRLVSLLSRAIAQNTLPPSLLLAGPSGVGKRRTALALAEAVNCSHPVAQSPRDGDPGRDAIAQSPRDGGPGVATLARGNLVRESCGECSSCRRIARGVHPEVLVVEPGESGSIKIEQVREAIDRSGYRPFEGRRRVVIIDEADALVPAAQNALLKTLEEPPSASIFCLVSSMPDALLPTVRSRCATLRFGPLSTADVAAVLMRDHGYGETDARAVAADADGSIGVALSASTSDVVEARDSARRLLEQAARTSEPSRRLEVAKDLTGKQSTPGRDRDQLAACLRAVASLLRDVGALAAGADPRLVANADARGLLDALTPAYAGARGPRAYAAVDRALAALERNASPKVVADWLMLQL